MQVLLSSVGLASSIKEVIKFRCDTIKIGEPKRKGEGHEIVHISAGKENRFTDQGLVHIMAVSHQ